MDLTDPILSRFDILTVIKDEVNEEADDALATFVINSHIKSHPEVARDLKIGKDTEDDVEQEDIERREATKEWLGRTLLDDTRVQPIDTEAISQDILKKYIMYARKYVHPKLNEIDKEKVT